MISSQLERQNNEKVCTDLSPNPAILIPKPKFRVNRPKSSDLSGASSLPDHPIRMSTEAGADGAKSRNSRDKRARQPPASTSSTFPGTTGRSKHRDRRRLREKRRSPGATFIASTEGTSTGEEEGEVFLNDLKSPAGLKHREQNRQAYNHHQHFRNHANSGTKSHQPDHPQLNKRLSPANALLSARFRGSKSQSDLDADCEDNTADYDSASMISASETAGGQSQFFIPDPSVADRDFQAHVQEIRMAGMQQLTASGAAHTDDDPVTGSSSDDMEEDLGKILEKERREKSTLLQQLGQQEDRIVHLERMVNELTKRLQEASVENQTLKAQNASLQSKGPR